MRRPRGRWRALVGELAAAALGLLQAELAALAADTRRQLRRLARIAAVVAIVAGSVFWGLGLLLLAAVEGLALWIPRWGAALAMAVVLGLGAGLLALYARREATRLESPGRILRKRFEDARNFLVHASGSGDVGGDGPEEGNR